MNKVLKFNLLTLFFLVFSVGVFAQEAAADAPAADAAVGTVDVNVGKTLFKNNCANCHAKNMVSKLTGPALAGVEERWAEYPQEDLYSWIRNSQGLIQAGHPRATELWAEWDPVVMNAFPNLTDVEIESILAYINDVVVNGGGGGRGGGPTVDTVSTEEDSNTFLFVTLFIILALLAVVLARIVSNLNYITKVRAGEDPGERRTLVDILTSKGLIAFVIFALIVLLGATTVDKAINLGRQQGYMPEQPIKYSHVTHAGLQQIECQYCHSGARRSKHAVIPPASTCMNCHAAIKVGSKYGTAELTKIYASVGWDPSTNKYIEGYEDLEQDEIKAIYTKWIADTYVEENAILDQKGERIMEDQWNGIVSALTRPEVDDNEIFGPIPWVRIHNLPDHAYFNHSQHVSVGKVECQTCHGQIQEMEVVYQASPLSMGWCVNCHRQTEVQFADNEYYNTYDLYHEQLQAGERDKVTVEDIGGIECQKCHY